MLWGEQSRDLSLGLGNLKARHGTVNKPHRAPFITNVPSIREKKNTNNLRSDPLFNQVVTYAQESERWKMGAISKSLQSPNAGSSPAVGGRSLGNEQRNLECLKFWCLIPVFINSSTPANTAHLFWAILPSSPHEPFYLYGMVSLSPCSVQAEKFQEGFKPRISCLRSF